MYKDKERKRQYDKQWGKDSRKFALEHHLCTCCFKEKTYGNEHTCLSCRIKANERKQKRKELLSEEEYNKIKQRYYSQSKNWKKKVTAERKEKGICVDCGKRKAVNGRLRCGICLEKDRERHRLKKNLNEDKAKNRQYRLENHLCYTCGTPLDKDNKSTVCDNCSEIFSQAGRKGKEIVRMKYSNLKF